MIPRWTREPLFHFLLLGGLLFALGAFLGGPGESGERLVVVTSRDIEWLRSTWQRRWLRPPTERELEGLIDSHIREQILYRHALEMGLDEHDTIIRRRLVQKLEFLTEDLVDQVEPSEEELRQHFAAHPDEYREPELRSFTHIYFSVDRRGEAAWYEAERVLAELAAMQPPPQRAPELGDRFMMQYDYPRRSEAEVARHMGSEFAAELFELDGGTWRGPLRSGYGVHLVRVGEITEPSLPDFAAVRDRIRDDLARSRRDRANEAFYDELRTRYEVIVEDS